MDREQIISKIKVLKEMDKDGLRPGESNSLRSELTANEIKKLIRLYFWTSIIDFDKIKNKLGPQFDNVVDEVFQEFIQK